MIGREQWLEERQDIIRMIFLRRKRTMVRGKRRHNENEISREEENIRERKRFLEKKRTLEERQDKIWRKFL